MIIFFLIKKILYKLWKLFHKKYSPIHIAVLYESKEMFEILLSKGADINSKSILYHIIKLFFFLKIIKN